MGDCGLFCVPFVSLKYPMMMFLKQEGYVSRGLVIKSNHWLVYWLGQSLNYDHPSYQCPAGKITPPALRPPIPPPPSGSSSHFCLRSGAGKRRQLRFSSPSWNSEWIFAGKQHSTRSLVSWSSLILQSHFIMVTWLRGPAWEPEASRRNWGNLVWILTQGFQQTSGRTPIFKLSVPYKAPGAKLHFPGPQVPSPRNRGCWWVK